MRVFALAFVAAASSPAFAVHPRLVPPLRAALLDDAGGGAGIGPEVAIPVALAIVPGFGLGHFWIGDKEAGMTFLAVDAVLWLGGLVAGFIFGFKLISPGGAVFAVLWLAVRVWQVLDLLGYKVGDVTGAIPPRDSGRRWAALNAPPFDASLFRPATAR